MVLQEQDIDSRQDLRIGANPALNAAQANGAPRRKQSELTAFSAKIIFTVLFYEKKETIKRAIREITNSPIWKNNPNARICFAPNGPDGGANSYIREASKYIDQVCARDPRMMTTGLLKKGKNNAWNVASAKCSGNSDCMMFMDADIMPDPNTFEELATRLLKDDSLSIVGAWIQPFEPSDREVSGDLLNRCFLKYRYKSWLNSIQKNTPQSELLGGLYAIRSSAAAKVQMPDNEQMAEDRYLTLMFQESTVIAPAIARERLTTIGDFIGQELRRKRSETAARELGLSKEHKSCWDTKNPVPQRTLPADFDSLIGKILYITAKQRAISKYKRQRRKGIKGEWEPPKSARQHLTNGKAT